MPITIKTEAGYTRNPDGTYEGFNAVSERTTDEMVAEINTAGQAKVTQINTAGANALAGIEQKAASFTDYAETQRRIDSVQGDISQVKGDIAEKQDKTISIVGDYKHYHTIDADNITAIIDYEDKFFGANEYFATKNLLPFGRFDRDLPYAGLNIQMIGDAFNFSGRTTDYITLYLKNEENEYRTKVSRFGTNKLFFFFKSDLPSNCELWFKAIVRDVAGNAIQNVDYQIGGNYPFRKNSITFANNADTATFTLSVNPNTEYNGTVQIVMTDAYTETQDASYGLSGYDSVFAFPYKIALKEDVTLLEYINRFSVGTPLKGIYCPEMFGAAGDGLTDDIDAIETCLREAKADGCTVIMGNNYRISRPLEIKHNEIAAYINTIQYTGDNAALVIEGDGNTISIKKIISHGNGIALESTAVMTRYNSIKVGEVISDKHPIYIHATGHHIFTNKIEFRLLRAGGAGFNCIDLQEATISDEGTVSENTFEGGQCTNADWAVYGGCENGKFTNIHVETNINGGFCVTAGCTIFYPRTAESARDGSFPFLKLKSPTTVTMGKLSVSGVKFYGALSYNNIDLTENLEYDNYGGSRDVITAVTGPNIIHGTVRPPIAKASSQNTWSRNIMGTDAILYGKRIIFKPYMDVVRVVSGAIDLNVVSDDFIGFPNRFIANANATVTLHPTYCYIGYSKFDVEQKNGNKLIFVDADGNVVFDGTNRDDGLYQVTFAVDGNTTGAVDYNGRGQTTIIEKIR